LLKRRDHVLRRPTIVPSVRKAPRSAQRAHRLRQRAPADGDLQRSPRVLLLIDVINPLQFEGAEQLAAPAVQAALHIAALKQRLAQRGVASVYVNDNFGHWRSEFAQLLARCRKLSGAPATLARRLAPGPGDFTVLKPRNSAFDQTPLELLLSRLGARELVITGLAADLCVQFTAMDAFSRGYRLWVPEDCTAAESPARKAAALAWMKLALKCRTGPAGP
jgi:nicotinamidase-related amidase